jgi:hypothetical protein
LHNDPAEIPKLIDKMQEGYDTVSGWRKYPNDHFSRVLPSKVDHELEFSQKITFP